MTKPSGEQGDFLAEAELALGDLGDGIVDIKQLSKTLNDPKDISKSYINIKSKGGKEFCIELTQEGYRIVGQRFDDNSHPSTTCYESLQALLSNESVSYVDSFAHSLQQKLFEAQSKLQQEDDDDENLP